MKQTTPELLESLQNILTQRLLAYILAISDGRIVGDFIRGTIKPLPPTEYRIHQLHTLVYDFAKNEDRATIQSWFLGIKEELNDRCPAEWLHQNFDEALPLVQDQLQKLSQL